MASHMLEEGYLTGEKRVWDDRKSLNGQGHGGLGKLAATMGSNNPATIRMKSIFLMLPNHS